MTSPDEGPEWADEAHLDEVFSTWVPGPPDSASAAEREMAGDNTPVEIPVDENISDQDMEAAIAAAMAEAEGTTAPEWQPAPEWSQPAPEWSQPAPERSQPATERSQPAEQPAPPPVSRRSEPAGPAWLNMPTPEDPRGPGPVPVAPPMVPEPVVAAEPESEREAPEAQAFESVPPPPPESTKVARPWTRSDDDILPGRRGKGRRR